MCSNQDIDNFSRHFPNLFWALIKKVENWKNSDHKSFYILNGNPIGNKCSILFHAHSSIYHIKYISIFSYHFPYKLFPRHANLIKLPLLALVTYKVNFSYQKQMCIFRWIICDAKVIDDRWEILTLQLFIFSFCSDLKNETCFHQTLFILWTSLVL